MLQIIRPRRLVECIEHSRAFEWRDTPGAGFGFPCSASGVLDALNPAAAENYRKCVSGEFDVVDLGITEHRWTYTEPAEGRCLCGRIVTLDGDTDCACGRVYNGAGQELAPRHMWGEETGETFSTWME